MGRIIIIFVGLLWVFPVHGLFGSADAPLRDYGFGTMEIFQFQSNTAQLRIRDINGDRSDDIFFLNNQASRLEILLRKKTAGPVKSLPRLGERFFQRGLVLDQWVTSFELGDINGDKLVDVVCQDKISGISIFYQKANHFFKKPLKINVRNVGQLKNFDLGDFDSDQHMDMILCFDDRARIFWNNGKGEFKNRSTIYFSSFGCSGFFVSDVNNDKKKDFLFYFPKEKYPVRLFLSNGKRLYGWEKSLFLPGVRFVQKVRFPELPGNQLSVILKNGMVARVYAIDSLKPDPFLSGTQWVTDRVFLKGIGRKDQPAWVVSDLDRDGNQDLVMTAPRLSQVHVYGGSENGLCAEPRKIDSITAIRSLGVTGEGDLIVFSPKEKMIARHPGGQLDRYPEIIQTPGDPLAIAVSDNSNFYTVCKKNNFFLYIYNPQRSIEKPVESFKLSIQSPPSAMKVIPLNHLSHYLVVLFMDFEAPVFFRLNRTQLTPVELEDVAPITAGLKPRMIFPVGNRDRREVLVCEEKVARLLRWNNGKFRVIRQLNPGSDQVRLSGGCRIEGKEGGSRYVLYDNLNDDLLVFSGGNPRPKRIHLPLGEVDPLGFSPVYFNKKTGMVLVEHASLHFFQEDHRQFTLQSRGEYVSQREKASLWAAIMVKLGEKSVPKLALMDSQKPVIDLIGFRNGKMSSDVSFEVFQEPGLNRNPAAALYEPHDISSGDINGDGIRDLVILVHDKLLVYLGE